MKQKITLILFVMLAVIFAVQAQPTQEIQNLTASTPKANVYFGHSVSISGNYAVVGVNYASSGETGEAYVFYNNNGTWEEQAILTASDAGPGDKFGLSVSISNNTIVVGAYLEDDGALNTGAAYIFEKPENGWENMHETVKIPRVSGSQSNDRFGYAVDIDGNNIIVSASSFEVNEIHHCGAVFVYTKPANGWENLIAETAKLTSSDIAMWDGFGYSLSIDQNTIIVGVKDDDDVETGSGSAYIYEKPANGWSNMTETAKLNSSDPENNGWFGSSVDIEDNVIIVGAINADINGTLSAGAVYIFEKPETGWEAMNETAKINANVVGQSNQFGCSVSIDENTILVGALRNNSSQGAAYIFQKQADENWQSTTEDHKITNSNPANGDMFGSSVSLDGNTAIIGAERNDDNFNDAGSAYIFSQPLPSIIVEPEDKTDICAGTTVEFNVNTTFADSYQWKKRIDNGNEWTVLSDNETYSGTSTSNLQVTTNYNLNNEQYSCTVTNSMGVVISQVASLTVVQATEIITQPAAQTIACVNNENIILLIESNGEELEYQWFFNNEEIENATNSTYTITTVIENTGTYTCSVTGVCGSQTSENSIVTINELTEIITQPVAETVVCENEENIILLIETNGNELEYQWYFNNEEIENATNSTYTITTVIENTGTYTCSVTGVCGSQTSENSIVTINELTEIITQPVAETVVCENEENIILLIATNGNELEYQWFFNGEEIENATNSTYAITTVIENTGTYSCTVTGTCGSQNSENSIVTINELTEIITQPVSQSDVLEESTITFSVTATGSDLTYQWRKDENDLVDSENINGSTTSELTINLVSNNEAGSYDCIVTGDCETITSENALLSIILNINENENNNILIYPNPTNGIIYINENNNKIKSLYITDILGKTIIEKTEVSKNQTINLSNFENGIYFIKIKTNNSELSKMIIKK